MGAFQIPVIWKRTRHDRGERFILSVDDIYFLRVLGKDVHFYSASGLYQLQSALEEWRILLEDRNFVELDRGALVNMDKIAFIYADMRQIRFRDSDDEVFCSISSTQLQRVRKLYPHIEIKNKGIFH